MATAKGEGSAVHAVTAVAEPSFFATVSGFSPAGLAIAPFMKLPNTL